VVRITTLVEDTRGEDSALKNEHGLSFLIEKEGHSLLFDTGQSDALLYNAQQLEIELSSLEYVVLSHGHYDHSGGLRHLVERTRDFELVVGAGFFDRKYGYKNNALTYLGNTFDEEFLAEKGIAFRVVDKPVTELLPGVHSVTGFPRLHEDEVINPRFKVMRDGGLQEDPFSDEILLVIESPKGLIVLLGCSHPGMRNMLDAVKARFDVEIYAVLGGTHLVEAKGEALENSIDYLEKGEMEVIGVSHCTGEKVMSHLSASNQRFFHNSTGSTLIVE